VGRKKIVNCKRCGKFSPHLSQHKLCPDCQAKAILNAASQLHKKRGEVYEKWLAQMFRSLERLREGG
jgi:ribosomal protein L37E